MGFLSFVPQNTQKKCHFAIYADTKNREKREFCTTKPR